MTPYSSLCDDFGVYVYLNTKMPLPTGRETVLHFFDGLRKTYPLMTDFDVRESGEYRLERDREQGSYRWVTLESKRPLACYAIPRKRRLRSTTRPGKSGACRRSGSSRNRTGTNGGCARSWSIRTSSPRSCGRWRRRLRRSSNFGQGDKETRGQGEKPIAARLC